MPRPHFQRRPKDSANSLKQSQTNDKLHNTVILKPLTGCKESYAKAFFTSTLGPTSRTAFRPLLWHVPLVPSQ